MESIADVARRDAKWAGFGLLACLYLFWKADAPLALAAGGLFAAEAALLWNRKVAGAWCALATPVLVAGAVAWLLADKGFSWGRLTLLLFMPLGFWAHWSSYGDLIRGKAGWDEAEDKDDRSAARERGNSGEINVWSDQVAASLGSIDPLDGFATPVHSPVIQVSDEDPRMKAAVEKARRTFSTFRGHWEQRDAGDAFLVKASLRRDGNSEVIWIEVDGLEPDFIHGTLANQPVNLPGLDSGDRIELPVADLYDWAVALDGADGPLGLFTDKIVREVQREARAALESRPADDDQAK